MSKPSIRVVAAIIQNEQNQFLITQRLAHSHFGGYWEFPGGTIEKSETPQQALIREIKEELDVFIKVKEVFWQEVFEYDTKIVDIAFYHCCIEPRHQLILKRGIANYRWVSARQLGNYTFPQADKRLIEKLVDQFKSDNRQV